MTMQAMMKMPMSMPGSMSAMPMQAMVPMMMATMTMKMSSGKTLCEFKPAPGMDKAMFENSCQMLEMMVASGMPIIMQSGNMCMLAVSDSPSVAMPMMMPMMSMMPSVMCSAHLELKPDVMTCQLVPSQGMNAEVFDASCKLMEKMMQLGMPMMITCNGSPVLCCTV
jgi:hypothetical protein